MPSDSTSSDVITLDGLAVPKAVTLVKDGKKGLGFTIEKGEKTRGSSEVLIASITPRGPADLEGTLQVGQQVLHVDKEKILGYAYEKVRDAAQRFYKLIFFCEKSLIFPYPFVYRACMNGWVPGI